MANYQTLGAGPVSFVDSNQNQQEIPLRAISFGPNGIDGSQWPLYSANQALVDALLKQMVAQGLLVQGAASAPIESMMITAADTGPNGNMISIMFSNPSQAAGTVTVAVNATETYPGLTLATIGTVLGTTAAAKGLLYLEANNNKQPIAFTGPVSGAPKYDVVVPDAASDPNGSFTLAATDQTYTISVNVAPDPSPATTFTLTVTGSKSQSGLTIAALESAGTNPFSHLVTFSGPAGAPLPAAGTVTLQGGAAATSTPAKAASIEVFSS